MAGSRTVTDADADVVVVHSPTYIEVRDQKTVVEVVQENTVVEVYGAVGVRGPQGEQGDRGAPGPAVPIVFSRLGPVPVLESRMRYRFPYDVTLVGVSATTGSGTPPVGAPLSFDLLLEGVPIQTVTIPDGSEDVAEIAMSVAASAGEHLSVAITSVGSTDPGEDLSIFVRYDT